MLVEMKTEDVCTDQPTLIDVNAIRSAPADASTRFANPHQEKANQLA